MRLIDADKLIDLLNKKYGGDDINESVLYLVGAISGAPTVDAEPVKHGHWITWFENEDVRQAKCSECAMMFTLGKGRDIHYCGNCGAKMDEVET